jgi:hypothetical protein
MKFRNVLPFVSLAAVTLIACTASSPEDGTQEDELRTGGLVGENCDSVRSCQPGLECKPAEDAGSAPIRVGLPFPQPQDAGSAPIRVGLPFPQPQDAGSAPIRVGLPFPQPQDAGAPIRVGLPMPQPQDAGSAPIRVGLPFPQPQDAGAPIRVGLPFPQPVTGRGVCALPKMATKGELCGSSFAPPGSPPARSCESGLRCVKPIRDPNGPTDVDFGICTEAPIRVGLPQPSR